MAHGHSRNYTTLTDATIEGVADKVPTSTRARQTIQQAFDVWQSESGQSLTYISKVLAMSVESPRVSRFHRTPA